MRFPEGYRRDAARLAACVCALVALGFAPFTLGLTSFLNSARTVPSVYGSGASPVQSEMPLSTNMLDMVGGWLSEPWLAQEHHMIWSARTPFWDPFDGYGVPFAASMQPQPLSPFELLAALPPTSPYVFDLLMLVRLMVAGVAAALFVRLFVGFAPALAAGVAAALGGYYMGFLTQPHLSVEVLIPALLLATELVVRRPGFLSTAALGGAAASVYLGGMPESAFIAIAFAAAYAIWRLALEPVLVGPRLASLAGAHAVGVLIGAAVMLPFAELLPHGVDVHRLSADIVRNVALLHDSSLWHVALTELAPLSFGPPWQDVTTSAFTVSPALRGYVGAVAAFLALVGVLAAASRLPRRTTRDDVVFFLLLVASACFAKRMGAPFLQWVGDLPVVHLIILEKYLEPVFDACVALLAGFGLGAVVERRASPRLIVLSAALVLLVLSCAYTTQGRAATDPNAAWFYGFVALALLALGTAAALALRVAYGETSAPRTVAAIVGCLFVELIACYPTTMFLALNGPQSTALDPYAGAPYVAFLQRRTAADGMRVLGTSGTLYPNWAGAFGLFAPTQHNAIYLREYSAFMDAFGVSDPPTRILDADRYTGSRVQSLGTPLRQRWLALSSVRYVATPAGASGVLSANTVLDGTWAQNYLHLLDTSAVRLTNVVIGSRSESALRERPTRLDIVYGTVVPRERPAFVVDLGIAPESAAEPACAASVRFTLVVEDRANGRSTSVTTRLSASPGSRTAGWVRRTIDLRALAGRSVRFRFGTAVPNNATCVPNALWGDPRFVDLAHGPADRPAASTFHLVFKGQANVFAYERALPRAAIFHDVRAVRDSAAALLAITAEPFDEQRSAVVVGEPRDEVRAGGSSAGEHAKIVGSAAGTVTIDAQLVRPGLVMLNDAFYDGWKAEVDGVEHPILRTDYLFRGVALGAGRHRIVIRYASRAVALGSLLGALGLLALGALVAVGTLRARRRPAFHRVDDDMAREGQ